MTSRIETLTSVPLKEIRDVLQDFNCAGAQAATCVRDEQGSYTVSAIFTRVALNIVFNIHSNGPVKENNIHSIPTNKVGQVMDDFMHEKDVQCAYFKLQGNGNYFVSALTSPELVRIDTRIF